MFSRICVALASIALATAPLQFPAPAPIAALAAPIAAPAAPRASGWFSAHDIPLPPLALRGNTTVKGEVVFTDQPRIDAICGGKDQIVACATIGSGGFMVLPNPCQPRFAGEAYASLVCHEMGHTNGWSHEAP